MNVLERAASEVNLSQIVRSRKVILLSQIVFVTYSRGNKLYHMTGLSCFVSINIEQVYLVIGFGFPFDFHCMSKFVKN